MNRELIGQLVDYLGAEHVKKCYAIAGGMPVSFATLTKEILKREIEQAISDKKSDPFIARKLKVSERTVRRYRACLHAKK